MVLCTGLSVSFRYTKKWVWAEGRLGGPSPCPPHLCAPCPCPQAQAHLERLKIHQEFKRLRKSLEEEESFLLGRLRWLEQEGDKLTERYGTATAEQLSSLREITRSLRAKQQMPSRDLLQVRPLGQMC